jgi:hypothetical protein
MWVERLTKRPCCESLMLTSARRTGPASVHLFPKNRSRTSRSQDRIACWQARGERDGRNQSRSDVYLGVATGRGSASIGVVGESGRAKSVTALGSTRAKCHSERWSGCRQAARGVVEPNTKCRAMCSGSNRVGSAGSLADIAFPVFEVVDVDLSTTPRRTRASDSSAPELIGQVASAAFRPSSFSSSETIRSTSKSEARCFQAPAVYSGANSSVGDSSRLSAEAKKQETRCPGMIVSRLGVSAAHIGWAQGQRWCRWQPVGRLIGLGISPFSRKRGTARFGSGNKADDRSARL